jgi:transposase-like protein
MVERDGNVEAFVSRKITSAKLAQLIRKNVNTKESILMTDEFSAYKRMSKILLHYSVDHSKAYCDGDIHTNTMECFWGLLKRGIIGQYHKVSRRYLPLYINEFSFIFSNRRILNDVFFGNTISRAVGGII